MANLGVIMVPILLFLILAAGLLKGIDVYDAFIDGAKEGISIAFKILPSLIGLLCAISMLQASGILDLLSNGLAGAATLVGLPKEVLPIAILRPVSGSGGIALLENLLKTSGPDSTPGRVASVIAGATETTFYTIAIYYGAVGIKKTRHTVSSAVMADFIGIIMSGIAVRLFF